MFMFSQTGGGTIYIGVTSDLVRRCFEHRSKSVGGFTDRYGVGRLVHFECFDNAPAAIQREKRHKKWNREWKVRLIEANNPHWTDLYPEIASP
jgi:putative endonuclease